jgi:xanthine dehydrogenase small subunit
MTVSAFFVPASLEEALELRARHGDGLLVMGGGTLLMGLVNEGRLFPERVMSLRGAGIDAVRRNGGWMEIGAAATVAQLCRLHELPVLAEAASELGGPALRTLATVGGNLFAPPPYGDLAVSLLALAAEVEVAGPAGVRRMPLEQLLASPPGPRELVTALRAPLPEGPGVYLRMGRRRANTPAVVAVAAQRSAGGVRIALGAAGPRPFRARRAEAATAEGAAAAALAAQSECDPPTDALATRWYRREMVAVLVRRALERLADAPSPLAGEG